MLTFESQRPLGENICARCAEEIRKLGFPDDARPSAPVYAEARFEYERDPYSGEDSLSGHWRDGRGNHLGMIKFHPDGTFYAEYDVAKIHPTKPRWFVESIVIFGRDQTITSEAKLIPALE